MSFATPEDVKGVYAPSTTVTTFPTGTAIESLLIAMNTNHTLSIRRTRHTLTVTCRRSSEGRKLTLIERIEACVSEIPCARLPSSPTAIKLCFLEGEPAKSALLNFKYDKLSLDMHTSSTTDTLALGVVPLGSFR